MGEMMVSPGAIKKLTQDVSTNAGNIASNTTAIGDLKGSYNVGSNTLANIQDAIYALVGDMQNGEQKNITFAISTAASPFSVSTYIGDLLRISRTRFRVEVSEAVYNTTSIVGRYKDGTWYWQELALKSEVAMLKKQTTYSDTARTETITVADYSIVMIVATSYRGSTYGAGVWIVTTYSGAGACNVTELANNNSGTTVSGTGHTITVTTPTSTNVMAYLLT